MKQIYTRIAVLSLCGVFFLISAETSFAAICAYQYSTDEYGRPVNAGTTQNPNGMEAQSFTVSSTCTLTSIGVKGQKNNSPTDNVTVRVSTNSGGLPTSTYVDTGTAIAATDFSTGAWATSTFSGGYSLVSGTTYWIVLGRSNASNDNTNYVLFADISTGSGLTGAYNSAGSSWASQSWSLVYNVEGTTGGGGGGVVTSTATSTVGETQRNLWFSYWTFFAVLFFVVWLFRSNKT